jgi:hypothetical protein
MQRETLPRYKKSIIDATSQGKKENGLVLASKTKQSLKQLIIKDFIDSLCALQ